MDFQDQTLTCRDCGAQFVWTASSQQFYQDKGFTNAPVRCQDCRNKKKAAFGEGGGGGGFGPRPMFNTVCSQCGQNCQVPFQPRLGEDGKPVKPVYCRDCFAKQRGG